MPVSVLCVSRHGCGAPEDLQQGLMHEPVDVLDMIVRLVGSLHFLLGFARVDALQDTQSPECTWNRRCSSTAVFVKLLAAP